MTQHKRMTPQEPPTTVESVFDAEVEERGALLLVLAEGQWFDRKGPGVNAKRLAEALVGFANAEGGAVVVGLRDRRVVGIDGAGPKRLAEWQQAAIDFTVPTVPCAARLIDCMNERGQPDHLLLLTVEASGVVHTTADDSAYLRVGDETRKLRFDQRRELLAEKGQIVYEALPLADLGMADLQLSDLDSSLLAEYAEASGSSDIERLLAVRGLLTPDGRITVGAALLFAPMPQTWLPQASVRVLRYRGRHRGTGSGQQLTFDQRIEGPLPEQLRAARQLVSEHVTHRRALGADGRFADMAIIPADAWFEGVVNAVVHRSYSNAGDHIRVEIFDDRIEVTSPGRFPGLSDGDDPREVMRFARNPRIARVCAELRFGQELGEGIRRMFDEMRGAGLVDPAYAQTSESVRLTLANSVVDSELERLLLARQQQVLRLLRTHEALSTGDIVDATGWSRPVVLKDLGLLRDKGLIEWVGRSRNDPWAYWQIRGLIG
jgi:ATP-dependent DNA helicase RecG